MTPFYGKYRGKVVNNVDEMQMGRILVSVPAVYGKGKHVWAMPCAPLGGNQVGLFTIPPTGANIWVEFEAGDTHDPIWCGCFWGAGEVPATPPIAEMHVLKTSTATITINDQPGSGGVKIETAQGAKIEISALGIEINNGRGASIQLTGPCVSVNNGALEVT